MTHQTYSHDEDNVNTWIGALTAIVILAALATLFFTFALPAIRDAGNGTGSGLNVNLKSQSAEQK